ncbi:hypothetical protein BpOF4_21169 (plasmid) [Alkalihalophilus pseudofirmus OF4]|uniref:Uncharacterized protein n=1 Tax=Alkalihalophilus pseudofirmus (strain ATCC BAA-2126 / JCM 17055 / OF4) TaxID=398511 RepID=D3G1K3_ALKPO|nr:hypothetical protein [Alkalihalophilus pseudofirmus]ADC52229.1 hypothetical protein BpOF4_21169 [Alkalihalophilus pseudofirmus OF4]
MGVFIRYQIAKPILQAAGTGMVVVGFGYLLDILFNDKNHALSIGAFIGAAFIVVLLLLKNACISLWFLLCETKTFFTLFVKKTNDQGV